MRCPACEAENEASAEACFTCGRAFDVLTRGLVLSGRYEVRRHVGSGGMGRVYEAFDRVLEEPVALKVLRAELTRDPDTARRFLSEIRLARKVSHRNVCRIHEYNEDSGLAFISMEYIEGRSLRHVLQARPLELAEAFDLALQAAQGLAAIHEHGIVHRDFKTQNIMVDGRGVAKILDFGIAKQVEGASPGFSTSGGRVFGTPEYMSPEQIAGTPVDVRSDVYALGCVTYELFTGRPPFQAETPHAILFKHLHEPPPVGPDASGLPAPLLAPLARALAKDPGLRHASTGDYIDAVRAARTVALGAGRSLPARVSDAAHANPRTSVLDVLPSGPAPPGRGLPLPPGAPSRRARWVWLGSAAAAAALAAAMTLDGLARREPVAEPPRAPASLPMATPEPQPVVAAPPATAQPKPAPETIPSSLRPRSATPSPRPAVPVPALPTSAASAEASPGPVVPTPAPTPAPTPIAMLPAPAPATAQPASPPVSVPTGGTLSLIVVPEAEVVVDEESVGTVSRRDLPLSPGQHTLRVLHPDYEPLPRRFTIRAGETFTLILDLAEKGIPKAPKGQKTRP